MWGICHRLHDHIAVRSIVLVAGIFYSISIGMVERASGLKLKGMVEGASALRADGDKCSVPQSHPSPIACVSCRPLLKRLGKQAGSLMGHCKTFPEQLNQFIYNGPPNNYDWKGVHTDLVHVAGCSINAKVHNVHKQSKVALREACSRAARHKDKAISTSCSWSIKDCSAFCFEQLSSIEGACSLHNDRTYPHSIRGQQCVFDSLTQDFALSIVAVSATGESFKKQCSFSCIAVCYGNSTQPWPSTFIFLVLMWDKSMTFYSHSVAYQQALYSVHAGHTPATNMRWPRQPGLGPRQPILQLILPSEQSFASHGYDPFICFP